VADSSGPCFVSQTRKYINLLGYYCVHIIHGGKGKKKERKGERREEGGGEGEQQERIRLQSPEPGLNFAHVQKDSAADTVRESVLSSLNRGKKGGKKGKGEGGEGGKKKIYDLINNGAWIPYRALRRLGASLIFEGKKKKEKRGGGGGVQTPRPSGRGRKFHPILLFSSSACFTF